MAPAQAAQAKARAGCHRCFTARARSRAASESSWYFSARAGALPDGGPVNAESSAGRLASAQLPAEAEKLNHGARCWAPATGIESDAKPESAKGDAVKPAGTWGAAS